MYTAPEGKNWLLVGAVVFLTGSVLINLGENVVKLSHNRDRKSLWWAGVGTFLLGNCLNFIALNLAAQSVLEGLGAVQFLSNLVFGVKVLHEKLATRHAVSTVLIVTGNALVVSFGDHESRAVNANVVAELAARPAFIAYVFVAYSVAILLQLLNYSPSGAMPAALRRFASKSGTFFGGAGTGRDTTGPVTFVAISALVGGNAVLLGKASSGLIRSSIATMNLPRGAGSNLDVTVFVVVLWVAHMGFWAYRLNVALKRWPALFIVPIIQSAWMTVTILSGGIFFDEFRAFNVIRASLFIVGMLMVLGGVVVLCKMPGGAGPDQNSLSAEPKGIGHAVCTWLDRPLTRGACTDLSMVPPVVLKNVVTELTTTTKNENDDIEGQALLRQGSASHEEMVEIDLEKAQPPTSCCSA